jgi:hypothetical protein
MRDTDAPHDPQHGCAENHSADEHCTHDRKSGHLLQP